MDKDKKIFEQCNKNCKSCYYHGDENENNCTLCINNYIFLPDIANTTNCVPKCNYYYYFSLYNIYTCTLNFQCPKEANLLIRNKNKCIDICSKDFIYKYQYSGECLEKCPDETNTKDYKCEIKNINSCSLSIFQLNLTFEEMAAIGKDSFTKNYVEEFNYTNNQIINYTNEEYSLVIYKNSSCIKELSLTIPTIDFGDCYQKIKSAHNIEGDLVISILEKYIKKDNSLISYLLFDPANGEQLNVNEICENESIIMKDNILNIPGINYSLVQFFADQDINVFNLGDKFYTDICKHYKSPNNRDIPLKLRFKVIFPNASLCEGGCISKGVDLKTMESICYCPFIDFSHNSIISNFFEYSETLGDLYSFVSNSNVNILFRTKKIFNLEYLKRCVGGFFIMSILFLQTVFVIIYFFKSKNEIKKYIYKLLELYISTLQPQLNNEPPKKGKKYGFLTEINNKYKNISSNSDLLRSSKNINLVKFNDEIIMKKKKKKSYNKNVTYLSKYANQIIIQNIHPKNKNDIKNGNIITNNNSPLKKSVNIQFNEYLSTDLNELDFEDMIEKDKITIKEYFCQSIKDRQLIINTFIIKDNIKPKSIKIILFLLIIVLCGLINGLMYSEEYLCDLYEINAKENIFDFIPRSISRLIYTFVIMRVLIEIIDCFFIEEKKLKGIFIRFKHSPRTIKKETILLIKRIIKYNVIFIIVSYIILIFSWLYISCFNDVYYYTRKDWMKSSLFLIILFEIYPIFLCFVETIIRFISIRLKSHIIFKISKFISLIFLHQVILMYTIYFSI